MALSLTVMSVIATRHLKSPMCIDTSYPPTAGQSSTSVTSVIVNSPWPIISRDTNLFVKKYQNFFTVANAFGNSSVATMLKFTKGVANHGNNKQILLHCNFQMLML